MYEGMAHHAGTCEVRGVEGKVPGENTSHKERCELLKKVDALLTLFAEIQEKAEKRAEEIVAEQQQKSKHSAANGGKA